MSFVIRHWSFVGRRALPAKVLLPTLSARMKERNELTVDQSCNVRPFGEIAFGACQAQIRRLVAAPVLVRNHVLDVKDRKVDVGLMDAAILAPPLGSAHDERPQSRSDHQSPEEFARS